MTEGHAILPRQRVLPPYDVGAAGTLSVLDQFHDVCQLA